MDCPACNKEVLEGAKFCRNCGALLSSHPSLSTSPDTHPIEKKGELFFPDRGSPVVPLTTAKDEETIVTAGRHQAVTSPSHQTAPQPIEEALPFTVEVNTIGKYHREKLEPRGLLRIKDKYSIGSFIVDEGPSTYRVIKESHVELLFVPTSKWEHDDLIDSGGKPRVRIFFKKIEDIATKGILKPRLIFKLKPEETVYMLETDPIERLIVLNISRKQEKLAKRYRDAIKSEIEQLKRAAS